MNIRDQRTISEQVRSGVHLAGWLLFTLAFAFLVLVSTTLLLGRGDFTRPIYRLVGACGLTATSAVMFLTVRYWVKWFFGAQIYIALKAAISLLLGFSPSVPSLVRPRPLFLELLLLAALAAALCFRYLSHAPRKIEAVGLVGLVVALSFTTVCDCNLPFLSGLVFLGSIQIASSLAYKRHRRVGLS